jgi:tetratricopeptide (TPR) repeat protein
LNADEIRFRDLGWLSLARIYYSTGHFSSAIAAWDKVPQSSEYYLDAQFEEAWAYFQTENLSRSLGNIHTINSPYFDGAFYPESIILKAVIFFDQCLYDDAKLVVDLFRKKYEPVLENLNANAGRFQDNTQFFDFIKKIKKIC